jgi:hypothetical protein
VTLVPNGITEMEISAMEDGEERRQQIEKLVDVRRHHAFLGDQLDDVGQRLQQSVRTHARRAHAHLHVRDHLALHPLQIGERRQQYESDERKFDDDVAIRNSITSAPSPLRSARTCSRFSITEFSILEYRPSVPDVNRLSCAVDQIRTALDGRCRSRHAVCCRAAGASGSGIS